MSTLQDEQELIGLYLQEAIIEGEFTMSDNFFTQNPQVVQYILKHEKDRRTGKPYKPGEPPITEEEALEVIRELRKTYGLPYVEQTAQAFANETGLEIED